MFNYQLYLPTSTHWILYNPVIAMRNTRFQPQELYTLSAQFTSDHDSRECISTLWFRAGQYKSSKESGLDSL
jgi:hypothetical protein